MRDFSIKKLYYSISEVSKITEVEQYILRYWETEFDELKPQKNRAGNRAYTNKDVQLILLIKDLLREKKYTIEGAKKIIIEHGVEKLQKMMSGPAESSEKTVTQPKTSVVSPSTSSEFVEIKRNNDGFDTKDLLEMRKILELMLKFL